MRYFLLALLLHGLIFIPLFKDAGDEPLSFQEGETSLTLNVREPQPEPEPIPLVEEDVEPELTPEPTPIPEKTVEAPKPKTIPTPVHKNVRVSKPKAKVVASPRKVNKKKSVKKKRGVTAKAKSLRDINPTYPWRARRRGWEGDVQLEFIISSKGRVSKIRLMKSSEYEALDKEAIKALQETPFSPARKDGRAVASKRKLLISFRLNKTTTQLK